LGIRLDLVFHFPFVEFLPTLEAMPFGSRTPPADIRRSSEGDQNVSISVEYF